MVATQAWRQAAPAPWSGGVIASPMTAATFVPESVPAVVYIARAADGSILYVGITGSLAARFATHKESSKWWAQAVEITIETWPDRATAAARETALIAELRPPFNSGPGGVKLEVRRDRDERFLELYRQGETLRKIAQEMGMAVTSIQARARRLRAEGHIGYRVPPAAR